MLHLRRDGTLRHVCFVGESDAIYEKLERIEVLSLLNKYFDFWESKITCPEACLQMLDAFRGRAPLPQFLSYISEFLAHNDDEKLQFAAMNTSFVYLSDDLRNLLSRAAYMNVAGRFDDVVKEINTLIAGKAAVMSGALGKLYVDASNSEIRLSEQNLGYLRKKGLA